MKTDPGRSTASNAVAKFDLAQGPDSSVAERSLGKTEVEGSIPSLGSWVHFFAKAKNIRRRADIPIVGS